MWKLIKKLRQVSLLEIQFNRFDGFGFQLFQVQFNLGNNWTVSTRSLLGFNYYLDTQNEGIVHRFAFEILFFNPVVKRVIKEPLSWCSTCDKYFPKDQVFVDTDGYRECLTCKADREEFECKE